MYTVEITPYLNDIIIVKDGKQPTKHRPFATKKLAQAKCNELNERLSNDLQSSKPTQIQRNN